MTVGHLFDLDKTLVVYEPNIPGIFRAACEKAGVEPTEEATDAIVSGYIETFVGFEESPYVGAARAAREAGLDIDPEPFAETYIETELESTHVPDGVAETLAGLENVGVVTNGYGPIQRRKLAETGLDAHIDALVCADDVEAFKPADAPFDAITEAVPAQEYVMVGDNLEYDIQPAKERGYRTVFVGEGDDGIADYRLDSPAELSTLPTVLARQVDAD